MESKKEPAARLLPLQLNCLVLYHKHEAKKRAISFAPAGQAKSPPQQYVPSRPPAVVNILRRILPKLYSRAAQ
mgnify:FL=1